MGGQFDFSGLFQLHRAQILDAGHAPVELAEHAGDAGIGVHQIGRGIALEAEHQLEVEVVVAAAVFGQIGIFHCANAHCASNLA